MGLILFSWWYIFFSTPCIFCNLPHLLLILFTKCKKINWLAVCFCCCFISTDLRSVRRFFFFFFFFFFFSLGETIAYAVSSLKTVTLQSLETERGPYPTLIRVQINISNVILLHHIHLDHYNYWHTEKSSEIPSIMLSCLFLCFQHPICKTMSLLLFF